jgi:hypothetical protein
MFGEKSRYLNAEQYEQTDVRGRKVKVVSVPDSPRTSLLGIHLLKQGQRPDHLAFQYLNDQAGYWRIAELNNVMLPEALTEQLEIAIPTKL